MRKILLLAFLVGLVGCASGSYLDRLGNALIDRSPRLGTDIASDPSPIGVGSALFQWIAGSLAVAGTGVAGVVGAKKVRKRRKKARLQAALDASAEIVVDAPLPLPPPTE